MITSRGTRVLLLSLLVGAASAAAQEAPSPAPSPTPRPDETPATRLHEWRKEREARISTVAPYSPAFIEGQILALEKAERPSLVELNLFGFYPRIQSIASGSRTAFGVRFWKPDIKGSFWDVHGSAFYSLTGYEFYDLQLGKVPHRGKAFPLRSVKGDDVYELGSAQAGGGSHMILYGSLRYQHYPRQDFYGLGPDSRVEDATTFRQQDALYELAGGYQVGRHLALTARAGFLQADLGRGEKQAVPATQDLFTDARAPGLDAQPDFFKGTLQAFLDHRDEPGNPHRGAMLALQLSRYDDRGGEAFQFTRIAVDARGYLALGSSQRVLALRAFASFDDPAGTARVPFYLQETLGGSHTLRGYPNFRFRGNDVLLLQAEYRWEPGPALELVLFADAGKVAARAGDLGLSGLRHDFGFGIRLKSFQAVTARFDVARSPETTRYLLRFTPSY